MESLQSIIEEFKKISSWEDKYKHIIALAKRNPEMPEDDQHEQNRVRGCQSQVWLTCEYQDGILHFKADSDAMIVKGIIYLILCAYNNKTSQEILALDDNFIDEIELRSHLSPNRSNGLTSIIKKIKSYAVGYKYLEDNGKEE